MDQNSFLLTLNSKLLTYLHSKNILTDDQFVDYIKNVNGNSTVGLSKVLKSTNSMSYVFSYFNEKITSMKELKNFVDHGYIEDLQDICICGNIKNANKKYCSHSCAMKNRDLTIRAAAALKSKKTWDSYDNNKKEQIKQNRINGIIKKYGIDHVWKNSESIEKRKKTWLKKYGVDNPNKNPEQIKKVKNTNIERYGFTCPLKNHEIKQKSMQTLFINFGVKNPMHVKDICNKVAKSSKQTYLDKWGFENPFNNTKFKELWLEKFEKNIKKSFSYKDYVLPSGHIIKVQGYENYAIDYLMNNFNENDFVFSFKIKRFQYEYENKKRTYIPDIYIKSVNTIYEVKSKYTLDKNLDTTILKAKSVIDSDINFNLLLCNTKQIKTLTYEELIDYKSQKHQRIF